MKEKRNSEACCCGRGMFCAELAANQVTLGPEINKILYNNLADLYAQEAVNAIERAKEKQT
jgi:hypothetical protein